MKNRKNRNKLNKKKTKINEINIQPDINNNNLTNDKTETKYIIKRDIKKEEIKKFNEDINEEELKEFMLYYEKDLIDDLNINYYYESRINFKYSKEEKEKLMKHIYNNIKEIKDFDYIKEFTTNDDQNADYKDDSDLNKSNLILLERKIKTDFEDCINKSKSKDILITDNKINKAFISYNIIKSSDRKYEWPNNIIYAGFKFYLSSHLKEIKNKNLLYIHYFCNNHRKIIGKGNNKLCNGKILAKGILS